MYRKFAFISIICFLTLNLSLCQTKQKDKFKFPTPIGFVNDFENILTAEQIDTLSQIIINHKKLTTNEIAIVTIDSIAPYKTLFDYTLDLFNTWEIGTKEKNNGVAVVFGTEIREIRIMVGKGMESKLTDGEAKAIIYDNILPKFKEGNYYDGVKIGLLKIIEEIK
jgi:uncharacterized protein